MIYFWRILCVFGIVNLGSLIVYDSGAGMKPVWGAIIAGSLLLSFEKPYHYLFEIKWFKGLVLIVIVLFLAVESCIIITGYQTDMAKKSDYIIVLGARVKGETPSLALQYRLDQAYTYLSANPNTKAILSGGQGLGENITEAEAMKRYLMGKGIAKEKLILENRSTNTAENIKNSFEIIDKEKENAKVIVVTSHFHILRSKMIAHDLGKKVGGIGAKNMPILIPNYYLREFFAVVKQFSS
ncbi:MAG: YdcF family protein [Cellulosilyticaceae bacterium]